MLKVLGANLKASRLADRFAIGTASRVLGEVKAAFA